MFCNTLPVFLPPTACVYQFIFHYLWEKFYAYIMKLFELNQYIYKLSFIIILLFVIILWGIRWINSSATSIEQIKKSMGFVPQRIASTQVFSTTTVYMVTRVKCLPEAEVLPSPTRVYNKGHPAGGNGALYLSG